MRPRPVPIPSAAGRAIWPYIGQLKTLPDPAHRCRVVHSVIVKPLVDLVGDSSWWREPWPGDPRVVLDYFDLGDGRRACGTTGALLREVLEICISGRIELQERGLR